MLRNFTALLLLTFALAIPAMAQVFPGVSAKEAEAAVAAAKAREAADQVAEERPDPAVGSVTEPTPGDSPTGPAVDSNVQREMQRKWRDAWGGLGAEQRTVARAGNELLRNSYADTRPYATGLLDYHSENFKNAANRLRSFAAPSEITGGNRGARETLLTALQGGQSLVEAGYADVFDFFDPERANQRQVEDRARRAATAAVAASRTAGNLGARPPYDAARLLERRLALEDWQTGGEAAWVGTWQLYQKAKDAPWDGDAVWAFAESLYQPQKLELNLRHRLVIRYMIANFPDHPKVKDGEANVRLAWSLTRTWQFSDAEASIETARTLVVSNADRAKAINVIRGQLEQERTRIERGLLNIRRD